MTFPLRFLLFVVPFVIAAAPASAQTSAQNCPACGWIMEISERIGTNPDAALARLTRSEPVVLSLQRASCDDLPDASFIMREIGALESRAFGHAESLAQAGERCPAGIVAARAGSGLLCEARLALKQTARDLDAAANALGRAVSLFHDPLAPSRLPEETLAAQLALEGNGALDLLRQELLFLSGNSSLSPDASAWRLAARDLSETGEMLRALADIRLADESALRLAQVLIAVGTAMGEFPSDAPEVRAARQQDLLILAADILWAKESVALSAERARRAHDTDAGPDTRAMAPGAGGPANNQEPGDCLTRASLSLSASAEAQRMMLDLLPQESGQSCPAWEQAPASGLSTVFERDLKYEKLMADLQRCAVRNPRDGN